MKAPDKVYINNYNGNDTWGHQWHTKPSTEPSVISHEYIRKDALLEWAKEKHDKAFRLHLKKGDKYHYGLGKMHAYKILIDKLNSM